MYIYVLFVNYMQDIFKHLHLCFFSSDFHSMILYQNLKHLGLVLAYSS